MNYFNLNLPLFKLDSEGKMVIPPNTDSIWFDVGTSFCAPNSVQFLNRNPNGFAIGFEPDPRAYFALFCAKSFSESIWILDDDHKSSAIELEKRSKDTNMDSAFKSSTEEFLRDENSRYIIIPSAVSSSPKSHINFNIDQRVGCSSIQQSHNVNSEILVSNVNLKEIIDLIPDKYHYIDHLKIDCEGLDIDVIKSAEESIKRFVVVSTELRADYALEPLGFEFIQSQPGSFSYVNKSKKDILGSIDYKVRV